MTPYQADIVRQLISKGRESVRGPHGLGKTALAAWVLLWFALTRDGKDWKAATTASAWRQLTKFLWPEVHKWSRKIRWDYIGRKPFSNRDELLTLSLRLSTGEAFAVASDNSATLEGMHADHILYVFDEAKIIPTTTFDAVEGAFSGAGSDTQREALVLAISTPGEPQGRFYEIHSRKPGFEDWHVRHVTLKEAIDAGRISNDWAEARERQWGKDSAIYQNRVVGEFASSDEDGVIPLSWVEMANERWRKWQDKLEEDADKLPRLEAVGIDVADGGPDDSVMAMKYGPYFEIRVLPKCDTMQTTGYVVAVLSTQRDAIAIVDSIGVGAGVTARLKEQGYRVSAFIASAKTHARDASKEFGFADMRSASWWALREELDPLSESDLALPPDDRLTGDLTAPKWSVQSGGKIKVEAKKDIKKRLGRSTDMADAVVQAVNRHTIMSLPGQGLLVNF